MRTVLLVEDSPLQSQLITGYLQGAGITVIPTTSVEEAREKLSYQRPDLIVLDVILPGQSGFEFCSSLKANPQTIAIPIVICSTKNSELDRLWGNMLGADAYLHKPVDSQQLLETVHTLMRR
jgi:DNA-binding response OmpR family regulator